MIRLTGNASARMALLEMAALKVRVVLMGSFEKKTLECDAGQWGPGCKYNCRCRGYPCNSLSGECECPPGSMGSNCDSCELIKHKYRGCTNSLLSDLKKFQLCYMAGVFH